MKEALVVQNLKAWIERGKLGKQEVVLVHGQTIFKDNPDLQPFHNIKIHGRYPDIIVKLRNGDIITIEAKGEKELIKAIGQALMYRKGSNYVYIAASLKSLSDEIINLAKTYGIGVLGVSEEGKVNIEIKAQAQPANLDPHEYFEIKKSISINLRINKNQLTLNHPGNYLIVISVLNSLIRKSKQTTISISELENVVKQYLQNKTRRAIEGSIKLGLIHQEAESVKPSYQVMFFDYDPETLYNLLLAKKGEDTSRFSPKKLYKINPELSLFFKMILLELPEVQLIIKALLELHSTSNSEIIVTTLAKKCFEINELLSRQFILIDNSDDIKYENLHSYFRYTLKSMLTHVNIIEGTLFSKMDPGNEKEDIWKLVFFE